METAAATTTPTTSADEASRAQVKAPEALSTAPSADAANNASLALPEAANDASRVVITPPESRDDTALLPPQTTPLPNPTTPPKPDAAAVPQMPKGHGDKAKQIEENIARFVGSVLPAEYSKGLVVDVVLANSNAVTGEAGYQNEHDLAVKFRGGVYSAPRDQAIQAALKSHPVLAGVRVDFIPTAGAEYAITAKTYGLDANRIAELLKPVLAQGVTTQFGVNRAEAANADTIVGAESPTTIEPPKIQEPVIEKPEIKPPGPAVDAIQMNAAPVQTAATEVKAVAEPVTQIVNPASHQGVVAANQEQAKGVA